MILDEAINKTEEQFGTTRLCEALNEKPDMLPRKACEHVKAAVDAFADGAEQFDDITMLSFKMSDQQH